MFRLCINHLQEAFGTSENQRYVCIVNYIQICVFLSAGGDLDIIDITPTPLVFEVPNAPWRQFKQNRNMLQLTMYLYDF